MGLNVVLDVAPDHDLIAKALEGTSIQDLGEEVRQVVCRIDMSRQKNFLVADEAHPLLTAVDVLQLRPECGVIDESLAGCVINLHDDGQLHQDASLLSHVANVEEVVGGIGSGVDLCGG